MVAMTHSIPEPNALAIRTQFGTIFHTGDWKIDPEPLLGEVTDEATPAEDRRGGRARHGVRPHQRLRRGRGGLGGRRPRQPEKLVATRKHRVAVTCFASNLARVESIAKAAVAAGRHPVLSGRALQRMVEAAQECGYLLDFPPTIAEQQAGYLPRDKVLFICTGSQGEPRASMAKLATGEHRDLVLERGGHGDLLLARHPGQREAGRPAAERAARARRRDDR